MTYLIVLSIVLALACVAMMFVTRKSLQRVREYEEFYHELEDEISSSLRTLRASSNSIKSLTQTPVMFDDPIVHRIIGSIQSSYSAINMIDLKLGSFFAKFDDNPTEGFEELTTQDEKYVVNFLESNEKSNE